MTTNFKSNIRARAPRLLNTLDVDGLYGITKQRLQSKDELFPMLSEESQNIMLNNVLIFNLTDNMLEEYSKDENTNVHDKVFESIVATEDYRQSDMYPTGSEVLTFMDGFRTQGVNDEGTITA